MDLRSHDRPRQFPTSLRDAVAQYADVARCRYGDTGGEFSRGALTVVRDVEHVLRETSRDDLLQDVLLLVVSDAETRSAERTTSYWAGVAGIARDLDLALAGWPTNGLPDAWSALAFTAATDGLAPPSV